MLTLYFYMQSLSLFTCLNLYLKLLMQQDILCTLFDLGVFIIVPGTDLMFGHELCPHSYRPIDGVCSSVFIVQKCVIC